MSGESACTYLSSVTLILECRTMVVVCVDYSDRENVTFQERLCLPISIKSKPLMTEFAIYVSPVSLTLVTHSVLESVVAYAIIEMCSADTMCSVVLHEVPIKFPGEVSRRYT